MPMIALANALGAQRAGSASPISAVERPAITPVEDGDVIAVTPADWDDASNYLPEGSTVTASSLTLNGEPADVGDPVEAGDQIALSVTVQATVDGDVFTRSFSASFEVPALVGDVVLTEAGEPMLTEAGKPILLEDAA